MLTKLCENSTIAMTAKASKQRWKTKKEVFWGDLTYRIQLPIIKLKQAEEPLLRTFP